MTSSSITGNYSVYEGSLVSAHEFGRRARDLSVCFHMSSALASRWSDEKLNALSLLSDMSSLPNLKAMQKRVAS